MTTISPTETRYWPGGQKAALRFFLSFFAVYMVLLNPPDIIPFAGTAFDYYIQPFHQFVVWLGANVFKLSKPITMFTASSGDTTYDYIALLVTFLLSGTAAVAWSVIDKKERNYDKVFYWLTTVLRYYLAFAMFFYGFQKVIKVQFPMPSPDRLVEPVGAMSPMALAWLYMGHSAGFNYFTGIGEIAGGVLLFFRRSTAIGALLVLVITGNIVAINLCFDVPVKLLSSALAGMSIFLLAKDARRLGNLFFFNQTITLSVLEPPHFNARWKNLALRSFKYVFAAYGLFHYLNLGVGYGKLYGDNAEKPPFYGIYNTVSFLRNKDTVAPLATDTTRWHKFIVNSRFRNSQVILMNDSVKNYNVTTDTVKHIITINTAKDTVNKHLFNYTVAKNGDLRLTGKWGRDTLTIHLRKYSFDNYTLINRGFHWVNEKPFVR